MSPWLGKSSTGLQGDKGSVALDGTGEGDLFSFTPFCVFSPSSEKDRKKQAFWTTKEWGRIAA